MQQQPRMDGNVLAGLKALGAPQEVLDAAQTQAEASSEDAYAAGFFDVWPENWDSVMFFLSVSTQWTYASAGLGPAVRLGLDYGRVEACARLQGIARRLWPALFADLQVMEYAVLDADSQVRGRA